MQHDEKFFYFYFLLLFKYINPFSNLTLDSADLYGRSK